MKTCSIVVVVLFLAGSTGLSLRVSAADQSGTGAKASQTKTETPSSSSNGMFYVLAEFTSSLNVKKLKTGDQIKARVTQDVLSHGRVIITAESKLLGHVTEVQERGEENSESRLGIVFDKVLLKHHEQMIFQGVVQALARPALRRSRVDEPDQMLPPPGMVGSHGNNAPNPIGSGSSRSMGGQARTTNPVPSAAATLPTFPVFSEEQTNPSTSSPLSVGTPQGVFGLKGLSLSKGASSATPGPVIVSKARNVKLESETQVLLKITDAPEPRH
jgi:hypothetical protein